ncbi:MAG: hypothetical protein LBS17_01215 [Actinomycetes bacterium]|jgi:hypothetical protein|nr:hypothetical protein [Actinomycetes bacterium]
MKSSVLRVLHGSVNFADEPYSLTRGLKEIGVEASLFTNRNTSFSHDGDITLPVKPDDGHLLTHWRELLFCMTQLPRYDVIHYHSSNTIIPHPSRRLTRFFELDPEKRRGQVVVSTFHGTDVRELSVSDALYRDEIAPGTLRYMEQDFAAMLAYSDLCYVPTADLLHLVPGSQLLPQSVLGLAETTPRPSPGHLPLTILHAPSNRKTKGTDRIIRVVEELIAKGYELRFVLLENCPHDEVLRHMDAADIVIDQVVMRWYCVVSVEAAVRAKAVVVHCDPEYIKQSSMPPPPFQDATEATLKHCLIDLYNNRERLGEWGMHNRRFVLERHDPLVNARRVVSDYQRLLNTRR